MATFSINTGTSTEAIKYDLRQESEIDYILDFLYDNTNKEIQPHDIRDAVLSNWSNTSFKETLTSGGTISYIGIDTLNPTNQDTKNKILLGKRDYQSSEILESTLLGGDTDVFLYNTKIDTTENFETKISILSGTNSSLFHSAPYLQSQVVSGTTQSASLDFLNMGVGTISFHSNSATVSISNIIFPTISESTASASNNRILKWQDGKLEWGDIIYPSTSVIGTTGSELNIYGNPTNLNGYPLEFTDSRECPISIGDVTMGSTFNSMSLADILRKIIYTYLPPQCSIQILPPYNSRYVEVGTSPTIKIEWTITKRTLSTLPTTLTNMIPGSYIPITTGGQVTITGTSSGVYISPIQNTQSSFKISVSDGTQSASASTSIEGIYPYFYGFSTLSTMTTAGLSTLSKLIETQGDKTIDISGTGNYYFIYDSNYPNLNGIFDDVNNLILGTSFSTTPTTSTLSSPTGLWASKQFKIYQWNGAPQIGPPSVNYQFKFSYTYESETLSLLSRFSVTPSDSWKIAINTCIKTLKTGGIWALTDVIYFFNMHNQTDALLNWKENAHNCTIPGNIPTFTTKQGFTGNTSTTPYLNTNFNPYSDGFHYTQNSATIAIWRRQFLDNTSSTARMEFSNYEGGNYRIGIGHYGSIGDSFRINEITASGWYYNLSRATGLIALTTTSNTNRMLYLNGNYMSSNTKTSSRAVNNNLYILARNNAGAFPDQPSGNEISFAFAGASLDATKMLTLYTAVNTFNTTVNGL
jgi:hypothetical protein